VGSAFICGQLLLQLQSLRPSAAQRLGASSLNLRPQLEQKAASRSGRGPQSAHVTLAARLARYARIAASISSSVTGLPPGNVVAPLDRKSG
jgi:hypothetical protein